MKKKKEKSSFEDAIKAFKKANREIELERNGGHWIAMDRPHKNKKLYNRKRDRSISLGDSYLSFFLPTLESK